MRYKIVKPLGSGGMGRVFLARDPETGGMVAVKILKEGLGDDAYALFRKEVLLLSRLSHPALTKVYDFHAASDGKAPCFTMEYVAGEPIDRVLAASNPEQTVALFLELLQGLHYLHSRGILHRDLKPSNVLASGGRVKILDFGLAIPETDGRAGEAAGTLAYLAPEARAGLFSPQSDLFALGVIFRDALSGRSDLPPYFAELIPRLLETDPSRRPSSALSLLKFLRRHADFPLPDETAPAGLRRIPWVARPEEKAFWTAVREGAAPIVVTGPTGVGRTRFLDEMKWKLATDGVAFRIFADLHEKTPEERKRVLLSLKSPARTEGVVILLEYDSDLLPGLPGFDETAEIRLEDLSAENALEMIRRSSPEAPVSSDAANDIARKTGGRPLLIAEALRGGDVPSNLRASCASRLAALSANGRRLLAIVTAETEAVSFQDTMDLWGPANETDFLDAQLELQSQGVLAHPSLRDAYFAALSEDERRAAHRLWTDYLVQGGAPSAEIRAPRVVRHALADGNAAACEAWGPKALEYHFNVGNYREVLDLVSLLTARPLTDPLQAKLYSYAAPSAYRLGLFDEAIAAYDRWHALKQDDGTGVEKVKHRLMTGITYLAAGHLSEAERALKECLAAGDDDSFAHHRPLHARAHSRLAALAEKSGRYDDAGRSLAAASKLADEDPLLLGEITQQRGLMDQARMSYDNAAACFIEAAAQYQRSENIQAAAIAEHSVAMVLREQGLLEDALAAVDRSLALAVAGGEILQQARYRENRALLLMDLGRYGDADTDMKAARDVLDVYGENDDRWLAASHEATFDIAIGHWERAAQTLDRLADLPLLKAELAYKKKDYADAVAHFERASNGSGWDRLQALLGLCRASLRSEKRPEYLETALAALKSPQGPFFDAWRHALTFLARPLDAGISETDFEAALEAVASVENPELRADLNGLLALDLKRRGCGNLSLCLSNAAAKDIEGIFNRLPEDLKMDFEKKRDLKTLDQSLANLMPAAPASTAATRSIPEDRFRQYCEINQQIARKSDPDAILERVLDACIEMTGAERGFVLMKDENARETFLPGFDVKTARRINRQSLGEEEFQISLSAVRQCVAQGLHVLTDDAQFDPRFREQQSVMKFGLKAMLVVPMEIDGGVIGAVYLDHRYRPNCFRSEDVLVLGAFTSQAALAIQKARMMEELADAKRRLEGQVQDQAVHISDLSNELAQARSQLRYGYDEIVGQSPSMMKVFQLLDHVTDTAIPVWILGESGTGKELVARSLHFNSHRKGKPFVAENVSAIPETLLESELFGHKKGSFTHADRDRVGLFEQANGGTLFLDEVADMSLAMQAKLLRVLQEGEVRPVGSSKKVKIDVRLVTASNKDLNKLVKSEKFREDLFFRINGLTVALPPLRERKDDIPLLADKLIQRISQDAQLPAARLSSDALQALLRHDWPGNVRELEAALRNALLFAKGAKDGIITTQFLILKKREENGGGKAAAQTARADTDENAQERDLMIEALKKCGLDKEAAAEELGISLRSFYVRMGRLKIPKKKQLLAKYVGLK